MKVPKIIYWCHGIIDDFPYNRGNAEVKKIYFGKYCPWWDGGKCTGKSFKGQKCTVFKYSILGEVVIK